jgi:hypothetical protein
MPVRITVLVKKLDSLADEKFHDYWVSPPPRDILAILTFPVQLPSPNLPQHALRSSTAAEVLTIPHLGASHHRASCGRSCTNVEPEFNGAAEFWVEKLKDFGTIFADPVYLKDVVPDEESFLKRGESVILVGEEQVKFVAGQ